MTALQAQILAVILVFLLFLGAEKLLRRYEAKNGKITDVRKKCDFCGMEPEGHIKGRITHPFTQSEDTN